MANKPELIIKIVGDDKEFRGILEDLPKQSKKASLAMSAAATAGAAGVTALAAGLVSSIKASADFEKSFSNVITLLDKSSFSTSNFEDGVDDLRNGILKLRSATGETFENLNKGLFDLISAGVSAEKAIKALTVATNLSIAGATDTTTAVDGITSALNAYELSADSAQSVAEKFFTAQKFGKTTVEELSQGFGLVASSAYNFGVSLDELLAAVSAATTGGIQTSQAYTGLAAILANISKPTKDAADEAERLGITFNSSALRAQGLDGFLKSITENAKFNSTSLEKLFGSVEAVKTIMAITGAGADDFANILQKLGDESLTASTFQQALAQKNDNLDQSAKRLSGTIETISVRIGNEFAPIVKDAFDEISKGIDENDDKIINFIRDLSAGMFTVASIIGDFFKTIFNRTLGEIQRFAAGTLANVSNIVRGIQNVAASVGIDLGAEGAIRALEQQAIKFAESANKNLEQGTGEGFRKQLEQRLEDIRTYNDEEAEIRKEAQEKELEEKKHHQENIVETENEIKNSGEEADIERADRKAEREAERFETDLENLRERLQGFDQLETEFQGLRELRELEELKKRAKTAKQKEQIDKSIAEAGIRYSNLQTKAIIEDLGKVFDTSTTLGKTIFLIQKAIAIADTIKNTQQAAMLAYASQLIAGDPTSIARAEAARAYTIAKGIAAVGVIAATSVAEVTGAREGGIVAGGSFGRDTEPFMLAKDEIIIPSKLNPLSPNFEETFGGFGLGQQNIGLDIVLNEEASRFITVKQREDRRLGIQT